MKKFSFFFLVIIVLGFAGCLQGVITDGGVYKSSDRGENWEQKALIGKEKNKILHIGNLSITDMLFEPGNTNTIYVATKEGGIYYTDNQADQWKPLLSLQEEIKNIDIDSKDTKIMYISKANQLYKSEDKGQTWKLIYTESRGQMITDFVIDSYDPNKLYIGLSSGELLKSFNKGTSWSIIYDFKDYIEKILMNKKDTRIIYVATRKKGLFKTTKAGETWQSFEEVLKDFSKSNEYQSAVLYPATFDAVLYASQYGLLKTMDGGKNWQEIKLLTPSGTLKILSIAVNPSNEAEIIYGTSRGLFKTVDGGKNWITKTLPTSAVPYILLVDSKNPNIIYMGTYFIQEKKSWF